MSILLHLQNIKGKYSLNIFKSNFKVHPIQLRDTRSPLQHQHQRSGSVNQPTLRVCVGCLLAHTLRLHCLQYLSPCLRLCVCWHLVQRPLTYALARTATSQFCLAMWPDVFTLLLELLHLSSMLFETETATGLSNSVSKRMIVTHLCKRGFRL